MDAATREGRALTRSLSSEAGPSGTALGAGPPVSHVEDGVDDERNLDLSLSEAPKPSREVSSFVTSLPVVDDRDYYYVHQLLLTGYFPLKELLQAPAICKEFRKFLTTPEFFNWRASVVPFEECFLSALGLYLVKDALQLCGCDMLLKTWMRLPLITAPNLDEGEDLQVASDLGIVCLSARSADNLVVLNLLRKERRDLPSLNYQRRLALISLQVTIPGKRYIVIAVGSVPRGNLSRKTEVYDSETKEWTVAPDVPKSFFLSDSHQTGAFCKRTNRLYMLGLVQRAGFNLSEAVLAFDVKNRKWIEEFYVLPSIGRHDCHLVECGGRIFLFSRELSGGFEIQHIDRLDFEEGFRWTPKVTRRIKREQHDLLKPEYTCVPAGEARLGIFKSTFVVNVASERICEVYDIKEDESVETEASDFLPLPPFIDEGAVLVPAKNFLGFAIQPSFRTEC